MAPQKSKADSPAKTSSKAGTIHLQLHTAMEEPDSPGAITLVAKDETLQKAIRVAFPKAPIMADAGIPLNQRLDIWVQDLSPTRYLDYLGVQVDEPDLDVGQLLIDAGRVRDDRAPLVPGDVDRQLEARLAPAKSHRDLPGGAEVHRRVDELRADGDEYVAEAAEVCNVQQVSLVINYDLPTNRENYIHRIGRTGRAGASGVAISLVSADEIKQLKDIERLIKRAIDREEIEGFEPQNFVQQSPPVKPARKNQRPKGAGSNGKWRGGNEQRPHGKSSNTGASKNRNYSSGNRSASGAAKSR